MDKFPGKRGLRKSAKYTLEFALLADGVPTSDVYKVLATPAGVDRAFAKLDKLKANIQWWEAGAQPPQLLASGDLVMSAAYNGRISAAQVEGKNLKVVWNGSIYDVDSWAIPKGSPNKAEALKFMAIEGHGVAWLPRSLVAPELRTGTLQVVAPELPMDIRLYRSAERTRPLVEKVWAAAIAPYADSA